MALLGLLVLSLAVLGACNYRWVAVLSTFQFKTMDFVSVFPAYRDAEGNYERQCTPNDGRGRKPNALLFSLNMVGTEKNVTGDLSEKDNDTSIRPGDLVKKGASDRAAVREGDTITAQHFLLDLDCLESYPDADLATTATCQGTAGPQDVVPNQLTYRRLFQDVYRPSPKDREALAVAIMLDQSGSMKGFVDSESRLEVIGGNSGPWDPVNWKDDGTDPDNTRFTAVKSFFALLNANDRAAIFEFSEPTGQGAKIVCDLVKDGTEEQRRQECFGSNHKLFTGSAAFNALQGSPKGRTPLWSSIADVYGFMKANGRSEVRHIIVITDGPDTCHPSSPDFRDQMRWFKNGKYQPLNQPSCADIGYDEFLTSVLADLKDLQGNWLPQEELPVHISFIQIQAPGYTERDARQQEIACLTGGHYTFINAQDLVSMGTSASKALQTAVSGAMQRMRGSLAGNWTVAVDLPDLANDRLPMGANVAIQGSVKLLDGPVTPEAQSLLRVGYIDTTSSANSIPTLDLRGAIRVPCAAGDSCTWYPEGDAGCEDRACRAADQVCARSWKAEDTGCGTDSSCCWGECQELTSCETRDALCNVTAKDDLTTCGTAGVCCAGACVEGASSCATE
jgi:hypothetical protein